MYATMIVAIGVIAMYKSVVELLTADVFHLSFRLVFCSAYLVLLVYLLYVVLQMDWGQFLVIRDGENIVESVVHLRVRHFEPNFSSPNDRGMYENWKNLMGDDPLLWFIPIPYKATFSSPAYVFHPSDKRREPYYAGVH